MKKVSFYVILLIIWELVYKLGVDVFKIWKPYLFPAPLEVGESLINLVKDNTLVIGIIMSLKRLFLGYGISLVIGVIIGVLIVRFKYLEENMSSLILGLQTLPSVCWIPFSILWFGINESAILFVVAIGSIFAIAIGTESGIKNVNPLYIKAAKTMGTAGKDLYLNVIIPAAMPTFIGGLKQGWSFAWRALMAGEIMSATIGLGQILENGRDLGDIEQVMAIMIVIIILGLIFDKLLFGRIERKIRYKWGLINE